MPRYIVAVTHRKEYEVDAASADEATDAFWLMPDGIEPVRQDLVVGVLRRTPQLLLGPASTRAYRVEYRDKGRLIYEHVSRRKTPQEVRDHAERIRSVLRDMKKPADEIRVRELAPESLVWATRRRGVPDGD